MLKLSNQLSIPESEVELHAIRSQGAGGQNVNKLATAIHLRFDVNTSSLPDLCKQRLLARGDRRISQEGVIVIKAQRHRTQEKNREDALQRLKDLLKTALVVPKARKATKPSKGAKEKRLQRKAKHARLKASRKPARDDV